MAFSSIDDLVSEISNGKREFNTWSKVTGAVNAFVAGNWYDFSSLVGTPTQNTYIGANTVAQTPTDRGSRIGIWHGGPVLPDTKHMTSLSAWGSVATAVPGQVMWCDLLMYYPGLSNVTTGATTLINSNTFTASSSGGLLLTYTNDFGVATTQPYTSVRFTTTTTLPTGLNTSDTFWLVRQSATTANVATSLTNAIAGTFIAFTDAGTGTHTLTVRPSRYADGGGVRMATIFVSHSGSASTGTPVVSAAGFQYTNQAGTTGRTLGAVTNYTAGGTPAQIVGKVMHSGIAASNYGPFLPLGTNDYGVQSAQQYQLSTAYGGATTMVSALALVRPLVATPLVTLGLAGERNTVFQLPSLPRVYDDACLIPIFFAGAATVVSSTFAGSVDFAYG
jgi:hypothetical protein